AKARRSNESAVPAEKRGVGARGAVADEQSVQIIIDIEWQQHTIGDDVVTQYGAAEPRQKRPPKTKPRRHVRTEQADETQRRFKKGVIDGMASRRRSRTTTRTSKTKPPRSRRRPIFVAPQRPRAGRLNAATSTCPSPALPGA